MCVCAAACLMFVSMAAWLHVAVSGLRCFVCAVQGAWRGGSCAHLAGRLVLARSPRRFNFGDSGQGRVHQ